MLAPDRGNGQRAELGQNVLAHHTMVQLRRARFAAHRDILAIVPLREIGHRRPGFHARQGRGNRIFSGDIVVDAVADDSVDALLYAALNTEPVEPTELEIAQAAAVTAAAEAATAAEEAKTASDAAQAARQNRAIIQTGDLIPPGETEGKNSGVSANEAYMQAKTAADEAAAAQTASDAAAEATDVGAATRALVMAEDARDNAVAAQVSADTHRDAAVLASTTELKIVEKTKTVGDTSITVDGIAEQEPTAAGTKYTGLILDPLSALTSTGERDQHGRLIAPVDAAGKLLVDDMEPPMPIVSGRTAARPSIGFTYDSSDDTARLTLITRYLGSQTQMQFVRVNQDGIGENPVNPFAVLQMSGDIEEVGPLLATPAAPLAGDGVEGNGDDAAYTVTDDGKIRIDHDGDEAADRGVAQEDQTPRKMVAPQPAGDNFADSVAPTDPTKTKTLYYVETGIQETDETKDDGIDQTKLFLERNVVDVDGESTTTYKPVAVIEVTIDNTTDFAHIHYGLWNGLRDDGNTVAKLDLGTGFVTARPEGTGMTDPDHQAVGGMPNFGDATYNGNWVANIQREDPQGDGAIRRETGKSSMFADFVEDTVMVDLTGLATLAGEISGNRFSGAGKPTLNATLPGGLANADDFMGSFSGGFFGPSAAEAGGVFDYASKGNKNGAFRGSFGGAPE